MSTEGNPSPPDLENPSVVTPPQPDEVPRQLSPLEVEWQELQQKVASGSSWFLFMAAFTVINTVLVLAHSPIGMALGFILTDYIVGIAQHEGATGIGIAITLVPILIFVGLGFVAGKGARWAFVVGIILLILDTLVGFIDLGNNIISIGIHLWAIWQMMGAIGAISRLKKISRGA